jgi:hypothetical protein
MSGARMPVRALMLGLACACLLTAAGIDGKWTAEIKPGGKKAGAKKPAKDRTQRVTLSLKSESNQLSGTVTGGRKRAQTVRIQNGKIDGNRFSFLTVQTNRKGDEQKLEWRGTLEGDTLQGTRGREGARRGAQFTARREG